MKKTKIEKIEKDYIATHGSGGTPHSPTTLRKP